MPYESAERWNAQNPPGTPVRVVLRGGGVIDAVTAGHAQQWGELALVRLKGNEGVWTIGALICAR